MKLTSNWLYCCIYICILFFVVARELNEPARARKRAEPSWFSGSIASRVESSQLISLTSQLELGRAEPSWLDIHPYRRRPYTAAFSLPRRNYLYLGVDSYLSRLAWRVPRIMSICSVWILHLVWHPHPLFPATCFCLLAALRLRGTLNFM
jgi:hypothetical protein